MNFLDILVIIVVVAAVVFAVFYMLNKWAYKKLNQQEDMIARSKQSVSMYVIDKKRDKITNVNVPSAVISQVPKAYKLMKMYFVQAKIGPQIAVFMCDKNVYNSIPVKKTIKAEIAGMYIVSFSGMKTIQEMKKIQKDKKAKKKEEKKAEKNKK